MIPQTHVDTDVSMLVNAAAIQRTKNTQTVWTEIATLDFSQ